MLKHRKKLLETRFGVVLCGPPVYRRGGGGGGYVVSSCSFVRGRRGGACVRVGGAPDVTNAPGIGRGDVTARSSPAGQWLCGRSSCVIFTSVYASRARDDHVSHDRVILRHARATPSLLSLHRAPRVLRQP